MIHYCDLNNLPWTFFCKNDPFYYCPPIYAQLFQVVSFMQVSWPKFYMNSVLLFILHAAHISSSLFNILQVSSKEYKLLSCSSHAVLFRLLFLLLSLVQIFSWAPCAQKVDDLKSILCQS